MAPEKRPDSSRIWSSGVFVSAWGLTTVTRARRYLATTPRNYLQLAIAAAKNFELRQFDILIAFLSGDIDEMIYMEQPESYVDREHSK